MTAAKSKPFCPHLSAGQILTEGFLGQVIPFGEVEVGAPASTGLLGKGKLDLSSLSKRLPAYKVEVGAKIKSASEKEMLPVATASLVNCQGPKCMFWCEKHENCGEVCNTCRAEAFAEALRIVNKEGA